MNGRLSALALGVVLALALTPSGAGAAMIGVNTTADETTSTDGTCSLREALNAANSDTDAGGDCTQGSGSDTIQIPAGTYNLIGPAGEDNNASGDLDVIDGTLNSNTTTFAGAGDGASGTIIDAGNNDRAIDVQSSGDTQVQSVVVMGLTIRNGNVGAGEDGGAIRMGELDGALTVDNATIGNNHAGEYGGAIHFGPATVGGVKLHVVRTELIGNSAGENGGAIWFQGDDVAERAIVDESLVAANTAAKGGGIYVNTATPGSDLEVTNSTITSNTATGTAATDGGGGIAAGTPNLTIYLNFDTIAGNATALASGGGGIQTEADNQDVFFRGTIVAGNTAAGTQVNCREIAPGDGVFGGFTESYNLEGANTCGFDPGAAADLINTDPLLAPLFNNLGPTRTRGLYDTSPALDRIPRQVIDYCTTFPSSAPVAVDQREQPRPSAPGLCDVGAFEGSVGPVPPPFQPSGGGTPPDVQITVTNGPKRKCRKKHRPAVAAKKKCKKKRK